MPKRHAPGLPYPLGVSIEGGVVNFAVYSTAPAVDLRLAGQDFPMQRTGDYFHIALTCVPQRAPYCYVVDGKELLDPYARILDTARKWGEGQPVPHPIVAEPEPFDWQGVEPPNIPDSELVIYELHVRGFSSGGGYLDVIEQLPYLRSMGINAIELLPVAEFNESAAHPYNFWGYSPLQFFAPMGRYARAADLDAPIREFRTLVRECHRAGIQVIVDVVYNHTGEYDRKHPVSSLRGLAESTYYLKGDDGEPANYSGCGNTLRPQHPVTSDLILDSLRFWAKDLGVDGFRFDLASILTRGDDGAPLSHPPLIERITADPVLAGCKLIAEAWDAGGLYQVGNFAPHQPRWSEWNDRFRDDVRRFLRGEPLAHELATRLAGSEDIFSRQGSPLCSVNFVTAHDGFSLADLVSYTHKHNDANGEDGRDGAHENYSWNCGEEGATADAAVLSIRKRQQRNFLMALLLAPGIPMLRMGDECGLTHNGNNNPWCHDELNWMPTEPDHKLLDFVSRLLRLRAHHPLLRRESFLSDEEVSWHHPNGAEHDWQQQLSFLGMWLKDPKQKAHLYIAFNASSETAEIQVPWTHDTSLALSPWSSCVYDGSTASLLLSSDEKRDRKRVQPVS